MRMIGCTAHHSEKLPESILQCLCLTRALYASVAKSASYQADVSLRSRFSPKGSQTMDQESPSAGWHGGFLGTPDGPDFIEN